MIHATASVRDGSRAHHDAVELEKMRVTATIRSSSRFSATPLTASPILADVTAFMKVH
jgi:hypothetical protein